MANSTPNGERGDNVDTDDRIAIPSSRTTILMGHDSEVFTCAWNPVFSDLLASGSADSTVRIWSINNDAIPLVLNHRDYQCEKENYSASAAVSLDWSPDGTFLATGSKDGKVRIWKTEGGVKCSTIGSLAGITAFGPIRSIKWNKEGNYILICGSYRTAILDAMANKVKQEFEIRKNAALTVNWVTKTSFAGCSIDKNIYVFGEESKHHIKIFRGHRDFVNSIKWDPQRSLLVSCSWDMSLKVWKLDQRTYFRNYQLQRSIVNIIEWSPTGSGTIYPKPELILACASNDFTIRLLDVERQYIIYTWNTHTNEISSIVFSPDAKYLASGSFDKSVCILSTETGEKINTYTSTGKIMELCWNTQGDKLAGCDSTGNVFLLDMRNM